MHRHEVDVRLVLYERLSSVSVMNIPVDDENAAESVLLARVVCCDRNVAEQAESHRAIVDGVVSGRPDRGKAPWVNPADGEIDRGENTTGARGGCLPRAAALDGVGVDSSSALLGKHPHRAYVRRIVRKLELVDCRVPSLEVFDAMKQLRIFAEGARDGAQSTYMLRMAPPGIVAPAVTV
jgi:hypothetical protein